MPLKTFLLTFHLSSKPDNESVSSIEKIVRTETNNLLDQRQQIQVGDDDFMVVHSSTKDKDFFFTLRFYSSSSLISLTGEMMDTCQLWYRSTYLVERLKDRLNDFLHGSRQPTESSKDLVEAVPAIKRDNRVPLFFSTSDSRVLEYDFDEVIVNEDSEFQNIKILHSKTFGNCLLLDDMQNLAEADLPYTHGLMNFGHNDYKDKEILILGGGDGGLLHELLKEKPKFVTMIDIDEKVIDYCRKYLRGACGSVLDTLRTENYHVIVGDCLKYMQDYITQGRSFDVIFNDLTDIPISTKEERDTLLEDYEKLWAFVKQILQLSMQILRPGGLYLNHAIGINCKQSLADYEQVLRTLPNAQVEFSSHTRFVPSFIEDWVFYQVKKLANR